MSSGRRPQTYEFCEAPTLPMTGSRATLRVSEIVDGDGAFAEWWADFDCEGPAREEVCGTLRGWFGQWLESLRRALGGAAAQRYQG